MSYFDEAKYLADALNFTLSCWARSLLTIAELEQRLIEFQPLITEASSIILTDFLSNAKSANQSSYKITSALVREVDLKRIVENGLKTGGDEPTRFVDYAGAMLSMQEYGLLVAASFVSSSTLHEVLSSVADRPAPSLAGVAQRYAFELASYAAGLTKRTIMLDELEEIAKLADTLGKVQDNLTTDEFTLTARKVAALDKSISKFSAAAAAVKSLDEALISIHAQVNSLATRTAPRSSDT